MIKRKLGIFAECIHGLDSKNTLPLIKNAGFDCYATGVYELESCKELTEAGKALGLTCDFIHAPFSGINKMWFSGMDYLDIYEKIKQSIDTASACDIPTIIMHLSSGWDAPAINDLGLSRFDALVEYAAEKGVSIAFENLRKVGNLAYFADRYEKISNVGFCYDFGHEHCYTKTVKWMDIFTDRVIATHIHDNFGIKEKYEMKTDLHLLPFDGDIDYAKIMRKLDEYGYSGSLILEVGNSRHLTMKHEDFLADCYDRVKRISEM